ncbi:uncharacterized protein LOC120338337 isoform X3 [Styela clava]
MDKSKKSAASAAAVPGKKKVIRRVVKNAKTGEIIKTEIVRIDSSGEQTVTSYPAGTPIPSLGSLQSQGSGQAKKSSSRKPSSEMKSGSPSRRTSREENIAPEDSKASQQTSPPEQKKHSKAYEDINSRDRGDIGPSVPANVPGLEDLIKKEEELRRLNESVLDKHEKPKDGEESLETALITMMKRKRQQRNPNKAKRGLVASTKPRRHSDDEIDKALDDAYDGDTDYRGMPGSKRDEEDEEAERKRKERHRRRREKKHRERAQAPDHADVEEYQGETGPLDMPDIESFRKRNDDETPMEVAEGDTQPQQEGDDEQEISKQLEDTTIKQEDDDTQPNDDKNKSEDSGSDDDKRKKKKKHKHKKKKKKTKKTKDDKKSESEKEGDKEERKRKSRSRSRSLSSLSLSSISSAFSDSFDFAGMDYDPSEEGGFDMAMMEYQQIRAQQMGFMAPGPFFFRGRGGRGFPRGRGFPPGAWRGRGAPPPGFFPFFPGDPNFVQFPGMPGEKGGDSTRGRGQPVNLGPWKGRGLRGRGIPPGFHRNYTEDDKGDAVYVEESGSSSSSDGGKKKKKKKHRKRSYSSRSYSSSGSSRSRSRSRRRHRRRHRSSSYSSRSSRSYSRSSYSSRSRSRSYSRSYSSYSRSSSRSRSRSSRRSKSGSRRREGSTQPWGYDDGRASPSYRAYDEDGFKPPVRDKHSDDEEVPWWAEFDKTYEVEKKKLEEEKRQLEEEEKAFEKGSTSAEPEPPSIVSTDEIDVVRCLMNLVDKARSQQDECLETARECLNDIVVKVSTAPVQATQLHEEIEDPFDKVIQDCVDSILDKITPNDPQTASRLCLKEIIDTVVEQEEEDKANEEANEMEKEITESEQSRLFQCYLRAQKLTEQIKAERRAKGLVDEMGEDKTQNDDKQKTDDRKRDRRGHRSRHRRRSRSRSRDRGRRRRRRSSSGSRSRSSSRSSDRAIPLVSKESLKQAQAVLMMQQQQLQVAGLLGTGMPNLAGLTQAAALAAGITPALLAQTAAKNKNLNITVPDDGNEIKDESKFTKWDKDKDAMSKTKSKDDLTRKLMQRMREKKLKQEDGDMSPTFQARNKDKNADVTADKVFVGPGSLKSRKIAISSTFGKLWSKVEGSPKQDEEGQDGGRVGYNKSDIVAASADIRDQLQNAEQLKAEEQEKKLAAWSDQQARLKEEAKREMREQIERAERAKKEKMKEEILEQERQNEIMRIREEVRNQIRKEIQEEIEKQRKTVLEDPTVREKLLELEALRSQSGLIANEGVAAATSSVAAGDISSSVTPTMATGHMGAQQQQMTHPGMQQMRDQRWYQQQVKNKQDMQKWMESHGYFETEMDESTMKRMQMTYMQNWNPAQKSGYMQWYWQNKQQVPASMYYQQQTPHSMMQRQASASQGASSSIPPLMGSEYQGRDSTFTHAPSQQSALQEAPMQDSTMLTDSFRQGVMAPRAGGQGIPPHGRLPHGQGMQQPDPTMPFRGGPIPSLMDRHIRPTREYGQPPPSQPNQQFRDVEHQTYDYNHERRPVPTPQDRFHWQRDQPQPSQTDQQQPAGVGLQQQQQPNEQQQQIQSVLQSHHPKQQQLLQGPPGQGRQIPSTNQPLHQYPPPGMEEQPKDGFNQQRQVQEQPPPPGEVVDMAAQPQIMRPPSAVDDLAPPGEEGHVVTVPPSTNTAQQEDDSPSKLRKKKKQKKHRKHKKKKYSSSEDEADDKTLDPEAEKAAILAQLQHLKDVEDGEIASGDEGTSAVAVQDDKETKRRKKHKKEKRRHRKKKEDSSDEEMNNTPQHHALTQNLPPPPVPPMGFFPPMQGAVGGMPRPSFDPNQPNFPGVAASNEQRPPVMDYPPHSGAPPYNPGMQERGPPFPRENPQFMTQGRERPGYPPHHPRDHRGSGDPQHMMNNPQQHKPPMGPSGDHNPPPRRKRTPSPLPLVIPTDPQEFELWQKKMEARYNDKEEVQEKGPPKVDQELLDNIATIRRRQGDGRDPHNNEDVMMMMRMIDEEQRRSRPSPASHDRPIQEGRKRHHGHMSRGRKRSRRQLPRKNYHDWDKPEDDGMIYCMSGSDSSGWGSDTNMDFDRMLAKKRRETGHDARDNAPRPQRSPPRQSSHMDMEMRRNRSPGHMMQWDRRDHPPRNEDMLQGGEKPQGIPVIGGGPRPIPTNVTSGRPTPPRRHPDMGQSQGGMDYLPPDIIKLPPHQYPPSGYPPDPHLMGQRRDPGVPLGMHPTGHPIPRLGGQGAPSMPPMMLNQPMHQPPQGRMNHMGYRPRY